MNRVLHIQLLVLLLLLTIISLESVHATRRALVIGIGAYPESTGWSPINGDKDIVVVENMLVEKGFSHDNIRKLTNEQATAAGIREALQQLVQISQKNDFVYIHFSGHGQRITDTNGDEASGYDEAWIPYDAQLRYSEASGFIFKSGGYSGQNHLIDDELNEYLHQLRQKIGQDGKIIVVADACHSGGSTRELDDEDEEEAVVIRGTSDDFVIPSPRKTAKVGGYDLEWIFISACKSTQCNYEYHGSGSLTYAMSQLADRFDELTCTYRQKQIRDIMRHIVRFVQTPTVESSNPDGKFF